MKKKNTKTPVVFFDLDGTLLYSMPSITKVTNLLLAEMGLPPESLEGVKKYTGYGTYYLVETALAERGIHDKETVEKANLRCREILLDNCTYDLHPYEGIPELLRELKERGYKIAVNSNKPDPAVESCLLAGVGSLDLFDAFLGQREGIERKPSPDGVNMLLEELGGDRERSFFVGDSDADIETGANAGMKQIAVTWGFQPKEHLEECHPTYIVDNVLDILKVVPDLRT